MALKHDALACAVREALEQNYGTPAADRGSACGAVGADASAKGAPPTNRAPSQYKSESYQRLRFGVDSLYLSYPGVLAEEWEAKLSALKDLAQSPEESQQALAQVVIGDHLFEVRDKGRGRFAYVLVDNCYQVQVSNARSHSLPLAYVQISSEYLAAVGVEQAELSLRHIANTLGLVSEPANVSRVDLFVDFCSDEDMSAFHAHQWITRTQSFDLHYRYGMFSGWSIGAGGVLSARLYDKTLEVEKKSHKFYLHDLWKAAGWDGKRRVWRMEFQAKRDALMALGIVKIEHLLKLAVALWGYLACEWLRLAVPSATDDNASRWPNHPLWDALAAAFLVGGEQTRLKRFKPQRLPADERLFVHGLGGLTSFMAREGIEDLGEGIGEFLHQAKHYHDQRHDVPGVGFERYLEGKVAAKGRRYNTLNNRRDLPVDKQQAAEYSEAYRRERDGE